MDPCAHCGHALGEGRFCAGCGRPRDGGDLHDWRTDTAERPAVRPAAAPLPAWQTPSKPRYPLYADDPVPADTGAHGTPAWETAAPADDDRRRPWLPWVLVAAALVLVAGLGILLMVGGDDPGAASDPGPDVAPAGASSPANASPSPPSVPSSSPPPASPGPDDPRDVARATEVTAPRTARPSRDVDGNVVRYVATNMVDGQSDTAWRVPGDGGGTTLTLDLAGPTRLTEVGLVNGYAKREPGYDGYAANRRIVAVDWTFADGTTVRQTLGERRSLQRADVDVVTDTVELRIVAVTRPGRGPSGRDYTAISELSLVGVPV